MYSEWATEHIIQSKVANPQRCPWSGPVEVTSDEGKDNQQQMKISSDLGNRHPDERTEVKQYTPPSGGAGV
jgi:hypothetical protein